MPFKTPKRLTLLMYTAHFNQPLTALMAVFSISLLMTAPGICWGNTPSNTTSRITELTNNKVNVWKTVIYPHKSHILKTHRHDHDRVLVALSDGQLKVTNDKGQSHYITLKQDKAYYFPKDNPDEFHTDENISSHPISVMVIELKDD